MKNKNKQEIFQIIVNCLLIASIIFVWIFGINVCYKLNLYKLNYDSIYIEGIVYRTIITLIQITHTTISAGLLYILNCHSNKDAKTNNKK